ncbi:unnamed protein product [Parnassius mnemosyne]|uniref:Regulatory protein zeste n=1 Tax=Parnassius mnemosyne TaxID=213953 RepID=A0AAV1KD51_9NEOP
MANRVSNDQLEDLLEFLGQHPTLAKGVGLGARSKETVDKLWNVLATKLNAHGSGSSKSGERWKKYWTDLKHKSKCRLAKRRQDYLATGGGPSSQDDLSETDKKILSIIGKQAVFGDSEHRVPIFTTEPDTDTEIVIFPDTVKSPSTSGQTCTIYTSEIAVSDSTPVNITNTQTQHMAELPQTENVSEPPQTDQSKVDPEWVMKLEEKRVESEKKLADAAMVMAEASRMQAEVARTQAHITSTLIELVQRQSEDIRALLEARRLPEL